MNAKSILGSYLGHIAGYMLAGADIVSKINPALIPPQYGILISVAGLVTIAAHHGYVAGTSGFQAAADAAVKALTSAPAKVAAMLLLSLTVPFGMSACTTLPTPTQQAGITVAVTLAAGAAIQGGTQTDSQRLVRAQKFKSIALKIKAVNDAGTTTLATLAADLEPQLVTLSPVDQLAAHDFVALMQPYLNQEVAANPGLANTQATLDVILQAVIDSCTAYGA